MPEMGAEGLAEVLAVEPCPEPPPLPAGCDPDQHRLVTGVFRHTAVEVCELILANGETIQVTPQHPFWSIDRQTWVPAGNLQPGEQLKTLTGVVACETIQHRQDVQPVYNVEVDADHVYRVGEAGVLAHNMSNESCGPSSGSTPDAPRGLATGEVPLGTPMTREGHDLVATLRRNGDAIDQRQFVSGDLTPEEIALGRQTGIGWRIGDTENRALRAMADDLQPGDRLRFDGFFEPCPDCQKTMIDYARRHGVEIEYRYLDSANRVRVWSAQQGGYIYIGS